MFIDHLWVPAMKTGQIEYVEECLQRIDHTLSTWESYLTASCRYFTQKGLFCVLYRTQLFMKVNRKVVEIYSRRVVAHEKTYVYRCLRIHF